MFHIRSVKNLNMDPDLGCFLTLPEIYQLNFSITTTLGTGKISCQKDKIERNVVPQLSKTLVKFNKLC